MENSDLSILAFPFAFKPMDVDSPLQAHKCWFEHSSGSLRCNNNQIPQIRCNSRLGCILQSKSCLHSRSHFLHILFCILQLIRILDRKWELIWLKHNELNIKLINF